MMTQAVDQGKFLDYEQLYNELLLKCTAQETLIAELLNSENEKARTAPRLYNSAYEYLTNLQYKVKSLTARVDSFKSGQKYIDMKAEHKARLAEKDKELKKSKLELAKARCQVVEVREIWQQIVTDLEAEHSKALLRKDREIKVLKEKLLKTQIMLDDEREKFIGKAREVYQVMTELEDEKGKNQKLTAQINRGYENSSIPSSMNPYHKKIANSRRKTGKRPGGQPGHTGHGRKKQTPTRRIYIPPPEEYTNNPNYKPTGKIITKQLIGIRVELVVEEFDTPEFRHIPSRQRVHADFPDGVVNDVNYSGSIRAFAFLLNNHCNVSIAKVSDFLSELTGGELKISTGMINGLSKEFSLKTEAEQRKAFAGLLLSPVMNVDFTSARVNGGHVNVAVCATPSTPMYFAREHKGHEGVRGTPLEDYQGITINDHDKTFYNYGSDHQECLDHPKRYLRASMENEPTLQWNRLMAELLGKMVHFRKHLDPEDGRDPDQIDPDMVAELERRYDEILAIAKAEYEYEPPSKYNKDGFNLYKRLLEYKENHLLFLHDRRVPYTNSLAERLLRVFKRKLHQVMTFRSFTSLHYLCNSLGIVASLRAQNQNLYDSAASVFDRQIEKNQSGLISALLSTDNGEQEAG
jgi:hypothetical protein